MSSVSSEESQSKDLFVLSERELRGWLNKGERIWAALQPFLLQRGYKLRPRYQPDWVPSWKNCSGLNHLFCGHEDLLTPDKAALLDTVRLADGRKVVMKRVETVTEELPIASYLSSEPLASDPRNHTVPILDIVLLPGDDSFAILVMPMLYPMYQLPFRRAEELTEVMRQYLQGLDFMHERNIAHRDPCFFNLMMDATELIPEGFHCMKNRTYDGVNRWKVWHERRTCNNLRYYYIDFGISRRYASNRNIRDTGIFAQDKSFPERSPNIPYDPFRTDIYLLGNALLELAKGYNDTKVFRKFCKRMTRRIPEERTSIPEILEKLDKLTQKQLDRRLWNKAISWWWRPFFLYTAAGKGTML